MAYNLVDNLDIPQYYKKVLIEFLDRIREYLNDIECIALVGSIARGEDFIEGWSDIDVLVVVKKSELVNVIREIVNEVNNKYPKTRKGSNILSLWIDSVDNVMKWFGLGCEYYNVMKHFILIHGNDIRKKLREPSKNELNRVFKHFVAEARKYLDKLREENMVEKIDTLSLASLVYPIMRFYLCYKGYPVASRKEMIKIIKNKKELGFNEEEKEALNTVIKDLLERKTRVDPKLNKLVVKTIEKLLNEMINE